MLPKTYEGSQMIDVYQAKLDIGIGSRKGNRRIDAVEKCLLINLSFVDQKQWRAPGNLSGWRVYGRHMLEEQNDTGASVNRSGNFAAFQPTVAKQQGPACWPAGICPHHASDTWVEWHTKKPVCSRSGARAAVSATWAETTGTRPAIRIRRNAAPQHMQAGPDRKAGRGATCNHLQQSPKPGPTEKGGCLSYQLRFLTMRD